MMFTKKRELKVLLTGVKTGRFLERSEMMQYLQGRKTELLECGKDDDCRSIAFFIDSIIDDLHDKVREEN